MLAAQQFRRLQHSASFCHDCLFLHEAIATVLLPCNYCLHVLFPGADLGLAQAHRECKFPTELIPEIAAMGLFGASIEGYGCAGMNNVSYGLVMQVAHLLCMSCIAMSKTCLTAVAGCIIWHGHSLVPGLE